MKLLKTNSVDFLEEPCFLERLSAVGTTSLMPSSSISSADISFTWHSHEPSSLINSIKSKRKNMLSLQHVLYWEHTMLLKIHLYDITNTVNCNVTITFSAYFWVRGSNSPCLNDHPSINFNPPFSLLWSLPTCLSSHTQTNTTPSSTSHPTFPSLLDHGKPLVHFQSCWARIQTQRPLSLFPHCRWPKPAIRSHAMCSLSSTGAIRWGHTCWGPNEWLAFWWPPRMAADPRGAGLF